jgi:hypothetical protein
MAKETTKTGKALERQVADAYRAIGARKVEHDVELAGHQIDVYVEMEAADRSLHRIAVEAKDHTKPVGIKIVREFGDVVDSLRRLGEVDEGVIVSASGFSRQARNAAKEHGLRLLEPADLEAMAGGPDLSQMRDDYLASLRQRFEYLDLGGIAPRVQNRTVKLRMEDVFVPLKARPELEPPAEWVTGMLSEVQEHIDRMGVERSVRMAGWPEEVGEARPVDIPELLRRSRVVVLGDPGASYTSRERRPIAAPSRWIPTFARRASLSGHPYSSTRWMPERRWCCWMGWTRWWTPTSANPSPRLSRPLWPITPATLSSSPAAWWATRPRG